MSEKRPLADEIRPLTLDEVVGQKHLLGKGAKYSAAVVSQFSSKAPPSALQSTNILQTPYA